VVQKGRWAGRCAAPAACHRAYSLARCTRPRSSSAARFLDHGRVGAFITRAIRHIPASCGARPQGDPQVVGPPRPVSVRSGTRPGSPRPPQRARRASGADHAQECRQACSAMCMACWTVWHKCAIATDHLFYCEWQAEAGGERKADDDTRRSRHL
jgi:hypothetical protein